MYPSTYRVYVLAVLTQVPAVSIHEDYRDGLGASERRTLEGLGPPIEWLGGADEDWRNEEVAPLL